MPYTEKQHELFEEDIHPGVKYSFELKTAPEIIQVIATNLEGWGYGRMFQGINTARAACAIAAEIGLEKFTAFFSPEHQAALSTMETYSDVLKHLFGLFADQSDQLEEYISRRSGCSTSMLSFICFADLDRAEKQLLQTGQKDSILIEFDTKNLELTIKKI